MSAPFSHIGKQVLANGHHYADAADEAAAHFIADACNGRVWQPIETAPRDGTGMAPRMDTHARIRAALSEGKAA